MTNIISLTSAQVKIIMDVLGGEDDEVTIALCEQGEVGLDDAPAGTESAPGLWVYLTELPEESFAPLFAGPDSVPIPQERQK